MDNVIELQVYYYMYMYLKSLNVVVFVYNQYLQTRILPKANLFLLICLYSTDKKGEKLYRMLF